MVLCTMKVVFCQKSQSFHQNFEFFDFPHKRKDGKMDIKNYNSQLVTHRPHLGSHNDLKNDCIKSLFIHF